MRDAERAERMADQRRYGRFAVCAGDRDEAAIGQGFGEQRDVRNRRDVGGVGADRQGVRARVKMRNAGAPDKPVEAGRLESRRIPELPAQVFSVVPHMEMCAGRREGRRRRPSGAAETHDADFCAAICRQRDHRSFRVASPARASTTAMIQKRMTMVGSFQPFCSKWWCRGAMRNTRLPVSLNEAT